MSTKFAYIESDNANEYINLLKEINMVLYVTK